jgi:hypothetical protein
VKLTRSTTRFASVIATPVLPSAFLRPLVGSPDQASSPEPPHEEVHRRDQSGPRLITPPSAAGASGLACRTRGRQPRQRWRGRSRCTVPGATAYTGFRVRRRNVDSDVKRLRRAGDSRVVEVRAYRMDTIERRQRRGISHAHCSLIRRGACRESLAVSRRRAPLPGAPPRCAPPCAAQPCESTQG